MSHGIYGALFVCLGLVTAAQAEQPPAASPTSAYAASTSAYKDYMLQCAGCHRYDGAGVSHRAVPSFRNSVGFLTALPAGRDYMIRVPGAAQSQLNNAELADVLNWIVATYSPDWPASDFRPFTSSEVGAARPYRFDDVAPVRLELERQLSNQGYELSPYSFGINPEH